MRSRKKWALLTFGRVSFGRLVVMRVYCLRRNVMKMVKERRSSK